jgi:hypothetical protein
MLVCFLDVELNGLPILKIKMVQASIEWPSRLAPVKKYSGIMTMGNWASLFEYFTTQFGGNPEICHQHQLFAGMEAISAPAGHII